LLSVNKNAGVVVCIQERYDTGDAPLLGRAPVSWTTSPLQLRSRKVEELRMLDQPNNNRITQEFNVAVFIFGAVMGIFKFLVHYENTKNVPVEGIVFSIGLDVVRYLVVLLISALIIKAFWNRLISDVFSLRAINYQEAIAVILVPCVLFAS
jgi:hypothetical protein